MSDHPAADPVVETLGVIAARLESVEDLMEELLGAKSEQDANISAVAQSVDALKTSVDNLATTVNRMAQKLMPFMESMETEVARAHGRITDIERHAPLQVGPMR